MIHGKSRRKGYAFLRGPGAQTPACFAEKMEAAPYGASPYCAAELLVAEGAATLEAPPEDVAEDPSPPLQAVIITAIIRAKTAKAIFFILFSPLLLKL